MKLGKKVDNRVSVCRKSSVAVGSPVLPRRQVRLSPVSIPKVRTGFFNAQTDLAPIGGCMSIPTQAKWMEATIEGGGAALAAPPAPPVAHPPSISEGTGGPQSVLRAAFGGDLGKTDREAIGWASLDTYETTVGARPVYGAQDLVGGSIVSRPQRKIHARWWDQWRRTINIFAQSGDESLGRRAVRIDGCCQFPQIRRSTTGALVLSMQGCRDRLCPRCSRIRAFAAKQKLLDLIGRMNSPRFVTLTMKHSGSGLQGMHNRLMTCFKRLRSQPLWRQKVRSGIYVVETTRNSRREEWHVHLHLVIDGSFFPQAQLAAEWLKVTEDSMIVDIRAVPDRDKAASYVCDYLAKSPNMNEWNDAEFCEFAVAMHGRRLTGNFGKRSTKELDAALSEPETSGTEYLGSTTILADEAARGCVMSRRACEVLQRAGRQWATAVGLDPTEGPTSMTPVEPWEWEIVAIAVAGIPKLPPRVERRPEEQITFVDVIGGLLDRSQRRKL